MIKANELEQFRSLLLTLQARLRGDVQDLTREALDNGQDSKTPTHMAELGTETYEQEFSLRMMESEQDILDEVQQALHRIEKGTYGLCQRCVEAGKPPGKSTIPKLRLKVIPYARNCVECERKRESHSHR
ncbi:TraR/DksA family transcriptional regulator [Planctomyces sp. SH-PL14]|jgi:DnaK suppressor protein|uniref:TraR/DksA family transcriptional regulator n=1 Tax=Planctomyces sp. SH-PL14 TaxID=1632864 RepID=UPI00078B4641|nr:TraR/DksA family transcriptional regulator [Planctomyces sp. SH-PL14]AMV17463.1 General stress protein 16O [Planctomyces sp. SH-PL14]